MLTQIEFSSKLVPKRQMSIGRLVSHFMVNLTNDTGTDYFLSHYWHQSVSFLLILLFLFLYGFLLYLIFILNREMS